MGLALVTPPYTGRVGFLPRVCCHYSAEVELPFTLRRRQFPLTLEWVVSNNKSQGQSIKERLGMYLPRAVFAHGQAYVAFSRGGSYKGVRAVLVNKKRVTKVPPLGGFWKHMWLSYQTGHMLQRK